MPNRSRWEEMNSLPKKEKVDPFAQSKKDIADNVKAVKVEETSRTVKGKDGTIYLIEQDKKKGK